MTVKLLLLKSGEDVIADVTEMGSGDKNDRRVVGYFLNKPCIVKMRDPNVLSEEKDGPAKAGFAVSLFPWMPLSKEDTIPVTADWLITMVEPIDKLKQMYVEDILNHGKRSKDTSTSKSTDSD
tara:strand:+ start:1242 stop:1610 length:369 start_codon:yes stop_codon:yes gene_type:complete